MASRHDDNDDDAQVECPKKKENKRYFGKPRRDASCHHRLIHEVQSVNDAHSLFPCSQATKV